MTKGCDSSVPLGSSPWMLPYGSRLGSVMSAGFGGRFSYVPIQYRPLMREG